MIGAFLHELSTAARRVAARPGHALLSFVVLSLGLGTTLFLLGVVNGMYLKPLPFPNAERLVSLGYLPPGETIGINGFDANDWLALSPELKSFERTAIFTTATVNLTRSEGATRYQGGVLSKDVLPLLGAAPVLGRGFTAADDQPNAPLAVILSDRVWRNDFGADPAIVGKTLRANAQPATIVGVMAPGFSFPVREEVWIPRRVAADDAFGADAFALLRDGVSMAAARAELAALNERLGKSLTGVRDGQRLVVKPFKTRFVGEGGQKVVWLMFATSLLVLLLACANVANLTYTRTLSRARELAVRSALGAARGRLVMSLMVETLVIAVVATGAALGMAQVGGAWLMDTLVAAEDAPGYWVEFGVDWRMGAYAVLAAALATIVAGLVPALRATGGGVQVALRDGERAGGRGFARAAKGLVVAEIAITCVVLVSAGVFIRALDRIVAYDYGTSTPAGQVLTARVGLFERDFPRPADQLAFFQRVVDTVRSEPGVVAASAANALPGTASSATDQVAAFGEPEPAQGYPIANLGVVDRYFAETYGLRLRSGRLFDSRDADGSLRVAVVDRQMAETLWPGRDPLGQKLRFSPRNPESQELTVIGVVDDMLIEDVDDPHRPTVLVPLEQQPSRFVTIAVHTSGDALAFAPRLAEIVRTQNPDTPIYWVRTQQRAIEYARIGPVLVAQIFSAVGVLGLALAAAGLYGVLAFAVAQRTREIGVRRAVGASPTAVVRTVGDRVLWQLGLGIAIGCAIAYPWSGLLLDPSLDSRRDWSVFAIAVGVIVLAATFAALVPLRRALRVDPLVALRHE